MKRKVYTTRRERMTDQILGFLAFPLVNVPLWIIVWVISQMINSPLIFLISVLPWLVNGIVIVLAFLLRPQFGVGYMAFIAVAVNSGCNPERFVRGGLLRDLCGRRVVRDMGDQAITSLFVFLMGLAQRLDCWVSAYLRSMFLGAGVHHITPCSGGARHSDSHEGVGMSPFMGSSGSGSCRCLCHRSATIQV